MGVEVEDLASGVKRELRGNAVILATGHSARDMFELLHTRGLEVEAKPFAMGVRVEHPQSWVDRASTTANPLRTDCPQRVTVWCVRWKAAECTVSACVLAGLWRLARRVQGNRDQRLVAFQAKQPVCQLRDGGSGGARGLGAARVHRSVGRHAFAAERRAIVLDGSSRPNAISSCPASDRLRSRSGIKFPTQNVICPRRNGGAIG